MKTLFSGLILLGFTGTAAWADVTKDDVKNLLRVGISEALIRSYVEANRPVLPLSADDLKDLRAAGASDGLLVFLITPPSPPAVPPVIDSTGYPYDDYGYSYPPTYDYPYYPYSTYDLYPFYGGFSFVAPFRSRRFFPHRPFAFPNHTFVRRPLTPFRPGGHFPASPPVRGGFSGQGGFGGHAGFGGHGGMGGHGGHR